MNAVLFCSKNVILFLVFGCLKGVRRLPKCLRNLTLMHNFHYAGKVHDENTSNPKHKLSSHILGIAHKLLQSHHAYQRVIYGISNFALCLPEIGSSAIDCEWSGTVSKRGHNRRGMGIPEMIRLNGCVCQWPYGTETETWIWDGRTGTLRYETNRDMG